MDFSIIIPSYNRKDTLRRVLAGYEEQQPAELTFEVVVVDDGSDDGTASMLSQAQSRRYQLSWEQQENQGPAAARNRAMHRARGRFLLFTGDDIEPTPTLLQEHLEGHRESSDLGMAVLGLTRWHPQAELTATMRLIDGPGAQQFSYHYFEDGTEYDFRHFYTSNVSVRNELLQREPEGFSDRFPAAAFEDAEYAYRLARLGLVIRYRAAAVAYHHHPYGARAFCRRQERCGQMAAVLWQEQPITRKHLEIDLLERQRLSLLTADAQQRRRLETVSQDLEQLEDRAQNVATFFDPLPFPEADILLSPLFTYAYRKGLARALFGEAIARTLVTELFLQQVPAAASMLAGRLAAAGRPAPQSDLQVLTSLAEAA